MSPVMLKPLITSCATWRSACPASSIISRNKRNRLLFRSFRRCIGTVECRRSSVFFQLHCPRGPVPHFVCDTSANLRWSIYNLVESSHDDVVRKSWWLIERVLDLACKVAKLVHRPMNSEPPHSFHPTTRACRYMLSRWGHHASLLYKRRLPFPTSNGQSIMSMTCLCSGTSL